MILLLCWGTKTYLRNILETSYQLRTTFLFINNGHLGVIKEYVWVYSKNLSPITEGPKGPIMQIVLFQFLHTFLKIGQFRPLFPYFCLLNKVDSKQMFNIKVCLWLDSNCRPMFLEATALSTEPQPLPKFLHFLWVEKMNFNLLFRRPTNYQNWMIRLLRFVFCPKLLLYIQWYIFRENIRNYLDLVKPKRLA